MNSKKNPFDIYHIAGKIYLFLFDDSFDLCMYFLRYQEFYESPKFRNQSFTILEFIEWYSKTFGDGAFTYTRDWAGFNIPAQVIWQVHSNSITDFNKYDAAMLAAFNQISSTTHLFADNTKHDSFYILGACKNDLCVLGHELAHGLYATKESYREDMTRCKNKIPSKVVAGVYEYLTKIGYSENVFEDELQAYFATGLTPDLKKYSKYIAPFEKVFLKHTKNIQFDVKTAVPLQFK